MSKGTVKFFNESKGFGFITEEGVEKDHFVHISGLVDEIREGDPVEFDLTRRKQRIKCSKRKSYLIHILQVFKKPIINDGSFLFPLF